MWCCAKLKATDVLPSSGRFTTDSACNFILGATYTQETVPHEMRGKPDEVVAAFCEARCVERGAVGYFFQEHRGNGHEIVGFYDSHTAMHGHRVKHGHARGWLAFPMGLQSFDGTLDLTANFVPGAAYYQEELPAEARNLAVRAIAHCHLSVLRFSHAVPVLVCVCVCVCVLCAAATDTCVVLSARQGALRNGVLLSGAHEWARDHRLL